MNRINVTNGQPTMISEQNFQRLNNQLNNLEMELVDLKAKLSNPIWIAIQVALAFFTFGFSLIYTISIFYKKFMIEKKIPVLQAQVDKLQAHTINNNRTCNGFDD